MSYQDFGPPALAEPLLGNDFWQWQNHGDSRPKDYSIGVVVYRDLDLSRIKTLFPVIPEKRQDYRYVAYDNAVAFLEDAIRKIENHREDIPPSMIGTLKQTHATITASLGIDRAR